VRVYRYVDAALVRAVAHPGGLMLPPAPEELTGCARMDAERWRHWIERVWSNDPFAEAVELASPVLADRVRRCAEHAQPPKQIQRTGTSLHRYLLRLQHRSTPFGLFAGVSPAHFGPGLMVRWGEEHRPTARVDAVWLSQVIARLEACPELLRRLPVMANSTCFVRDERLVTPYQRPNHDNRRAPAEISVRHTPAVRAVMTTASAPVITGDLAGQLAADYPDTPTEGIEALLAELLVRGFLFTSLRPPMTVTDPLGHVIDQLMAVNAENITPMAPTVRALRDIAATLTRHGEARPEVRRGLRASVTEVMTAQSGTTVEQPLAVDLRLDCSLTLPQEVAHEAEKAVGALARLTPLPSGSPAWQDYHSRFLERFGSNALIPVGHLTDPDTGLDFPAGYRGSLLPQSAPGLTDRDEQLLALAQRAACAGVREVTLTDALMNDLAHGTSAIPLPHIDVRFHLQAPTRSALERGDFTLVVTGLTPAAGATAGRFLPLLDDADRDRMADAYASLPTLNSDALRAQVSCPPLHVRTDNVGRAPALWQHVISLAEHRSDAVLQLDDLAVTADATRLYLVSLSTRRPVEPAVLNAVDTANFTHPLARLLCELPRARAAVFGPFAWGAASCLPFLPGIRHGRSVLAAAAWRIEATALAGRDASLPEWAESLAAWRQRFHVPDTVDLGDDDRRLHLTLNQRSDAALLRAELNRTGHATVRAAPEGGAYGWFGGRAHEITLTLASTRSPVPSSASTRATGPAPVGRDHGHLPGASTWASAKLYGHPDRVPDILTSHLPRLWDGWDNPPEWWFVRCRDPQDHLRLHLRLHHPEMFGHVASRVGMWAADLRQRGLLGHLQWDTYYPETGRYGAGAAMSAAEAVFAADSTAALAQMVFTTTGAAHPQAVMTASLIDLATAVIGDVSTAMRWLVDHISTGATTHPTRPIHQETMHLANPDNSFAALRDLSGGSDVIAAWTARHEAIDTYRARLTACGGTDPQVILPSLMHTHHLRTAGIDEADEHICYRLARSAALAGIARGGGAST